MEKMEETNSFYDNKLNATLLIDFFINSNSYLVKV